MNLRRFALSFVFTGILSSPLLLNADAPKAPPVEVAPVVKTTTSLKHTRIKATVVSAEGDTVKVRLTGQNKGKDVADAQLAVVLMREVAGGEFSRMTPPPTQVKKLLVPIHLASGQKLDQIVTLEGVKLGSKASLKTRPVYAQVHAASKKEIAQAGEATVSVK